MSAIFSHDMMQNSFNSPSYNNSKSYNEEQLKILQQDLSKRFGNSTFNDIDNNSTYQPQQHTSMQFETIPRLAQYGNMLVQADNLAQNRGSGNFNPSPNREQTTNRGNSYTFAFHDYGQSQNYDDNIKYKAYENNSQWDNVQALNDSSNQNPYVVGTSDLHPETPGSWKDPDFQYSYGTDQYQIWAHKSMQLTPNALMNFFFSEDNVNHIHNSIISEIFRIRNIKINRQSDDELLIIMRNNYLYALYGALPQFNNQLNKLPQSRGDIIGTNGSPWDYSPNSGSSLSAQIIALNKSVIQEAVKQVLSGIDMYLKFYNDASSLPMPLSMPVYTSNKGSKELSQNIGFESGHELTKQNASYNQRFNII